ncbi:MAG: T9SS type A sorting domain-containing protein [Bacteroidetes bacterium]|nr:T9SS type A sorting domain-containing protein [Bacteroidota bacterium]
MKTNLLTKRMKAIAIGTLISISSFAQVQHDLKLALDFENGIADSSTQNQTTLLNGAVSYGSDKWGNTNAAALLSGNGTPGSISLTNIAGNYKISFPATISAWVKLNSYGTPSSPIFTTEDHPTNYSGLWVEVLPTGAVFASYGNNTAAGSTSRKSFQTASSTISLNEWYHIAVVYHNTSSATVYVNGFAKSTTTSGSAISCLYSNAAGTEGKIGGYNKGGANKTLDGQLDKVSLFGAALTKDEILALYYTNYSNRSTLLLNYDMNNNISDRSIYNHTSGVTVSASYETDRLLANNEALNTSTGSAAEVQEPSGNFKCSLPMSFATWIKVDALGSTAPIFTNDDNLNVYSGMFVQLTPTGNIAVQIGDGVSTGPTSRRTYITTTTLAANSQWRHLAVILKPSFSPSIFTTQVYLDGVIQPLGAQSGTGSGIAYYTGPARIGAYYKGTANLTALNGALDDVMFWNDSLNSSQVQDVYNNYYVGSGSGTVGIKNNKADDSMIELYPNPTNGSFTIDSKNEMINEIQIIDLTGKLVFHKTNINKSTCLIDLNTYPKGMYIVKTNYEQKQSVNKLIIN